MNILYVGQLNYGSTCLQRMNTLQNMGHEVKGINVLNPRDASIIARVFNKLKHPIDFNNVNRLIIENIKKQNFDLLWIDKGLLISPETLETVRQISSQAKIIAFSPDDMLNPSNQSKRYLKCIPLYDYHITTKTYNVSELKELGAKEVIFTDKSFDPHFHRKINLSDVDLDKYASEVGFIGQFEKERFESMLFLAKNGIKVTVRGPSWQKHINVHPNLLVKPGFVLGVEYAKIINATKINLCFLRKVNRDVQTARSIEIPACGAFMLGERTSEHLHLFKEGEEAEFFSSVQELLEKVRYYLEAEEKRGEIALKGLERCLKSGYSHEKRLNAIIQQII